MRIAVDIMGSDASPDLLFEGVCQAAKQLKPPDSILVFLTQDLVDVFHKKAVDLPIEFLTIFEMITMDDSPLHAVRKKKKSSTVQGMQLLNAKEVDAFVSAGNTGALVTAANLYLHPLKGCRPALLTFFPTEKQPMVVVDVGGTLTALSDHLVQYARLGISFQRTFQGLKKPKVGLLNIGSESKKGTEEIRKTYQILKQLAAKEKNFPFSFVGNMEGKEAFLGKVDVLVTDGFTGNIFLKTAEGMSSFIFDEIKQMAYNTPEQISQLQKKFGYDEYPGAMICGVDGIVVKCHGYSTAKAMTNAILGSRDLIQKDILNKMKEELAFDNKINKSV